MFSEKPAFLPCTLEEREGSLHNLLLPPMAPRPFIFMHDLIGLCVPLFFLPLQANVLSAPVATVLLLLAGACLVWLARRLLPPFGLRKGKAAYAMMNTSGKYGQSPPEAFLILRLSIGYQLDGRYRVCPHFSDSNRKGYG